MEITVTEKYCASLLEKGILIPMELPRQCHQFESFSAGLKRRTSNRGVEEENVAFAGMSPHEAMEAMRAREHGHPHAAKIVRRMTTPSKPSESSWF